MKNLNLTVKDALEKGSLYPFAYIRRLSSVSLGRAPQAPDADELIEARFFGPEGEIRVFRADGGLNAVALQEEPDEPACDQSYVIANPRFGKTLTVRNILAADEDGQYYVAAARLLDWREN